jgi:hypothetical protein
MNTELKSLSKYAYNTTLQPNLYIFHNEIEKLTEFVTISATGDKIEPLA